MLSILLQLLKHVTENQHEHTEEMLSVFYMLECSIKPPYDEKSGELLTPVKLARESLTEVRIAPRIYLR